MEGNFHVAHGSPGLNGAHHHIALLRVGPFTQPEPRMADSIFPGKTGQADRGLVHVYDALVYEADYHLDQWAGPKSPGKAFLRALQRLLHSLALGDLGSQYLVGVSQLGGPLLNSYF